MTSSDPTYWSNSDIETYELYERCARYLQDMHLDPLPMRPVECTSHTSLKALLLEAASGYRTTSHLISTFLQAGVLREHVKEAIHAYDLLGSLDTLSVHELIALFDDYAVSYKLEPISYSMAFTHRDTHIDSYGHEFPY